MAGNTTTTASTSNSTPHIIVKNLTMAYGSFVLMRNINFTVRHGDIFIIMGGKIGRAHV
jgi:phospholipid/cholesterol/gamma-HCH transport system ATP-binding protein